MNLRNARLGDEIPIAEIRDKTWKDAYRGILPDEYLDGMDYSESVRKFAEKLSGGREIFYLAEDENGKAAGFIAGKILLDSHDGCELIAIYVLPGHQKKGYGRALFLKLVKDFIERGQKSMILWTFEKNKDREFYNKLGGVPKENKTITFGDAELRLTCYYWDDIRTILN